MRRMLLPLLIALALPTIASSHASAATVQEAWRVDETGARIVVAGITLPAAAGVLSLVKSGELPSGGKGIDNIAQYISDDAAIQATAFVYLTSYADAAIADYMTDKAVIGHFGPATQRISFGIAPVGGVADGAIRSVYTGAADGQLSTATALVHAGRWIVKLRVTGPSDRAVEVTSAIDTMLAGMRFDQGVTVHTAQARAIAACASKKSTAIISPDFPRDGQEALCIDRTIRTADGAYEVLRAASGSGPVIVPLDDAGRTMRFARATRNDGYQMMIHSVGRLDYYDNYAVLPNDRTLAAMIDSVDDGAAKPRSSATYAANGVTTQLVSNDNKRP